MCGVFVAAPQAEAATQYMYTIPYNYNYNNNYSYNASTRYTNVDRDYLIQLILMLQQMLQHQNQYQWNYGYGTKTVVVGHARSSSGSGDDEPDVSTDSATRVEDHQADLRGEVDMNDFENGRVFFVYGQDRNQIRDVESDYDTYADVDEDGDDLQKILVDSNLDGHETYTRRVTGLDDNTDYYFEICVEYEDDRGDDTLACGNTENFQTGHGSSNDQEPSVETDRATNIYDDRATLRGSVDMNDFRNGLVFFVYGEDERQISDVEDDYDTYNDVDEDGRDLQKVRVDSDLDDNANYTMTAYNLDNDTDYYFQLCVEYDDGGELLKCGGVEDFTTDN